MTEDSAYPLWHAAYEGAANDEGARMTLRAAAPQFYERWMAGECPGGPRRIMTPSDQLKLAILADTAQLEIAEQELRRWKYKVELISGQLEAKQALLAMQDDS